MRIGSMAGISGFDFCGVMFRERPRFVRLLAFSPLLIFLCVGVVVSARREMDSSRKESAASDALETDSAESRLRAIEDRWTSIEQRITAPPPRSPIASLRGSLAASTERPEKAEEVARPLQENETRETVRSMLQEAREEERRNYIRLLEADARSFTQAVQEALHIDPSRSPPVQERFRSRLREVAAIHAQHAFWNNAIHGTALSYDERWKQAVEGLNRLQRAFRDDLRSLFTQGEMELYLSIEKDWPWFDLGDPQTTGEEE